METGKNDTGEEQLEYESDEDEFELIYIESQAGGNDSVKLTNNEENMANETEYFEVELQESNTDIDREDEVGEDEEEEEESAEVDTEEESDDDAFFGGEQNGNNSNDHDIEHDNEKVNGEGHADIGYQIEDFDFEDDETTEKKEFELGTDYEQLENEAEQNEYKYEGSDQRERVVDRKTAGPVDEEVNDPFGDDELIEYVEGPNNFSEGFTELKPESPEGVGRAGETEIEAEEEDEEEEGSENPEPEMTPLKNLPIYLDFCDLVSDSGKDLGDAWLEGEIKVDFDFMKLYPPDCEEDEMYAEFDSLYDNLSECIDLKFSDILKKIKDIITHNCKRRELETDIDIHLTFGDLMNFTVSSDSLSSESLTLRDVLFSYERLKHQSPNADLHKFLLVRVWLRRNPLGQFGILQNASLNGYRLENLSSLISKKRFSEWHDGSSEPAKRIKIDSMSKS